MQTINRYKYFIGLILSVIFADIFLSLELYSWFRIGAILSMFFLLRITDTQILGGKINMKGEVKDCEMIIMGLGMCKQKGFKNHQVAPGTIIPLCRDCYQSMVGENFTDEEKE